ncbi:TetR/AcrR family transcriptional regulator [Leucobacter triazinivorans]|jgi:AcrR family transcriptional regulator|uniref:TetR/AcrR family transcriptional regulator n=1 Tax=Leucobacter triazinivorans TaxID=1784719 RepID=A0A4P6KBY8_9MICO|nr:TetR/AcrR family transcriptional regulator [Leucobacter triazinivorans]MBL5975287.1 TetR/AcrR family transcriptional regulator [Candidatus Leucobacter sulfamidivorax]MBX3193673.1 TetR/AcrR family transcriptional regulator [Microbacteriaceae bacterium]QBE47652.1 TetR/AcrR family transcriptional regulator [Leucobacter triazinivorans]
MTEPSHRDWKRQQTSHALARAAFELTREHGLEGYTIDDVVGRAGVSRRTFANYFSNKEEAVTALALEQLHQGISSMPELPADTALLDWVKGLAIHQLSGGLLDLLFQLRDLAEADPALRPYLESVHAQIRRTAQHVVGERAGNSVSKLTSHIIVGAAYGALSSLIDGAVSPPSSPGEFVEKVFSRLKSGL